MRPLTFHLVTLGARVVTISDGPKGLMETATVTNCVSKKCVYLLLDNGERVARKYDQCFYIRELLPELQAGTLRGVFSRTR